MNIDDVSTKDIGKIPVGSSVWPAIFEHQHELEVKYSPIETRNGFYSPDRGEPANLDDAQVQNWLKNMMWRTVEELAEAMEEYPRYPHQSTWKDVWDQDAVVRHHFEEIADALHFFVAASLVIDISPIVVAAQWDNIVVTHPVTTAMPGEAGVKLRMFNLVKAMGLVCNCLKNKPWKNTHMPTDVSKVRDKMMWAWLEFATLWKSLRCEAEDVYMLYMKKNLVNRFRQESNY